MKFGIIQEQKWLSATQLDTIAVALTIQGEHLFQYHGEKADYQVFDTIQQIPLGVVPFKIVEKLLEINADGTIKEMTDLKAYHWVENGKPIVFVKYNTDFDQLTLDMSHEGLETVKNPNVTAFKSAEGFKAPSGQDGELFFEIADICQSKEFGYRINGILVSNFVTPDWYNLTKVPTVTKYDYMGYCTEPRQILEGGYLTTKVRKGNIVEYWQAFKTKGLLLWKKLNGEGVDTTASANPLVYIVGLFMFAILFLILIFRKND